MSNLTPKQERFATAYIETGNASEAYRIAYDVKNSTREAVHVAASRVLANAKVKLRVAELKEAHQKRHEVTVDSLTREYEEARELAKEMGQSAPMVSATTGKAKLHGLMTDKAEVKAEFVVKSIERIVIRAEHSEITD